MVDQAVVIGVIVFAVVRIIVAIFNTNVNHHNLIVDFVGVISLIKEEEAGLLAIEGNVLVRVAEESSIVSSSAEGDED